MACAAMKMKVQPQYAASVEPLPVQISTTSGGVSQVEKILPGGWAHSERDAQKNILLAENAFI
jgi:hypothetical protein